MSQHQPSTLRQRVAMSFALKGKKRQEEIGRILFRIATDFTDDFGTELMVDLEFLPAMVDHHEMAIQHPAMITHDDQSGWDVIVYKHANKWIVRMGSRIVTLDIIPSRGIVERPEAQQMKATSLIDAIEKLIGEPEQEF